MSISIKHFKFCIFGLSLLVLHANLQAQQVVKITSLPVSTPAMATIFLASSANTWNPGDAAWTFAETENGWYLNVPGTAPNTFQGKITQGSWATVEGNSGGGFLPNRSFNFANSDTVSISVAGWEGQGGGDLPENLIVLDPAFFMPQLNRSRRVRVLLPTNYDNTNLDYPVLYMHDGQNLFSASEAFAGEWMVDEAMAAFEAEGYPGAIIVAVDNGGSLRIAEYTPWANPQYGGGEGMEYAAFLATTLKPYIDEAYRTLPDQAHTGVMGSSLGGLISHYTALAYPDVFGKVGVLSPSFWFTDDIYTFTQSAIAPDQGRYFYLAGGQESASLQGQVQEMVDMMIDSGVSQTEIRYDFVANGQHSEWFWAQEFPAAFEWLFIETTTGLENKTGAKITLYPNPTSDTIHLSAEEEDEFDLEIIDLTGRSLGHFRTENGQLDVQSLPKGIYRLSIVSDESQVIKTFVKL